MASHSGVQNGLLFLFRKVAQTKGGLHLCLPISLILSRLQVKNNEQIHSARPTSR
jgi:hypothetical protein